MLPRADRLTDKKLFALIGRAGTWQRGRFFSLRSISSRGTSGQMSVVMSKKVAKLATERNRTKRRLRAVFQALRREERYRTILAKHHILVVVHRLITEVSPADLTRQVEALVSQLEKVAV